jgi:sugar-specific transcriptional regulator TrmB
MAAPELTAALERSGLTRVEANVYLALLQNGAQAAGTITKSTGIHRRTVYDAIARLIEKGLVSYIRANNTRIYQATHPERLMELLKEQELQLSAQMTQLEALYARQPSRHETVFFRGRKGLKALLDDQLKAKDATILIQGATPAAVEQFRFYFPQFDRSRVQRRIKARLLFDQRIVGQKYVQRIPLADARMIKTEKPQDVVTFIYGDTISIVYFSERPFGIMIREQAIAEQHRNWFEILWANGSRIPGLGKH